MKVILTLLLSALITSAAKGQERTALALIKQFNSTTLFFEQFELAKRIVALHDPGVLQDLAPWLNHEDRHLRGNAAYIFASLGDDRGFESIRAILTDRSDRPKGQGAPGGNETLPGQIAADRY